MAECSRDGAEGAAGGYLAFENWSNRLQTLFFVDEQRCVSLSMAVIGCADWKVKLALRSMAL